MLLTLLVAQFPLNCRGTTELLAFRWEHMLWTETNSYHPSCDPAQQWKFFEQPCGQGRRHLLGCIEDALKEMLVHKDLRTLCEMRGPVAAVLNGA